MQIRWKTTDLPALQTDPLNATAASAGLPGGAYGQGAALSANSIAVIVILPLLAIVCFVWFCFYSRRQHRMWVTKPVSRFYNPDVNRRDVELQRMNRRRRRAPVCRTGDDADPPPAYGVDNPVMSPHLTEIENLTARMEELERMTKSPGATTLASVELELDRVRTRIVDLKGRYNAPDVSTPEATTAVAPQATGAAGTESHPIGSEDEIPSADITSQAQRRP